MRRIEIVLYVISDKKTLSSIDYILKNMIYIGLGINFKMILSFNIFFIREMYQVEKKINSVAVKENKM